MFSQCAVFFFLFSLTSYSFSYSYAGSEIFTLTMRTVIEKAFILMYISLREHYIAVTQLKVTVRHIFISQLKIYKVKENLSINISIKSHPVFLSASRSSVARATSVPKVSPSRRSPLPAGEDLAPAQWLLGLPARSQFWNKFLRGSLFFIATHTHTEWIWKRTSR